MSSVVDLQATVDRLTERLGLVEDRQEIEKLQNQYGFYLDNRMWREVADLFCDDHPSIEIGQRGLYIGKDRVYQFLSIVLGQERWGLEKDEIINHIQLQMVIDVETSRDSAKSRSRALVQGNSPPGSGKMLLSEGVYECQYVKENQQWKIKSLLWVPTYYIEVASATPSGDFIFQGAPASDVFPPDAPAFAKDEKLGRQFVPFHYPHPVTGVEVPSPSGTHIDIAKRGE